jgi:hypothetical protein
LIPLDEIALDEVALTAGNPADATLAIGMIERHMERYGRAPQQVCFDGAFSSRANFEEIKRLDLLSQAVRRLDSLHLETPAVLQRIRLGVYRDCQPVAPRAQPTQLIWTTVGPL